MLPTIPEIIVIINYNPKYQKQPVCEEKKVLKQNICKNDAENSEHTPNIKAIFYLVRNMCLLNPKF